MRPRTPRDAHDMLLVPPRTIHARELAAAMQDEQIARFLPQLAPLRKPAAALRWLASLAASARTRSPIRIWLVLAGRTRRLAGALELIADTAGGAEIGFWMRRSARRRGLATRAVATLCDQCGANPLRLRTHSQNVAARKLAERCGFVLQSELAGVARYVLLKSAAPPGRTGPP
ncbi:MAG: GNAT family N-acetyltransferase [Rhodocyclaceae bacterium]|nr:GNAT family N-acetyltransferase [Rhodocyclaceae bacterium]